MFAPMRSTTADDAKLLFLITTSEQHGYELSHGTLFNWAVVATV
jgi:hypothetical protein